MRALHNDTRQELLGKFSVFTNLQNAGKVKNGMVVNIADGVTTWEKDLRRRWSGGYHEGDETTFERMRKAKRLS